MKDPRDHYTLDLGTIEPSFLQYPRNVGLRRLYTPEELAELKRVALYYREKPYLREALRRPSK